MSRKDYLDEVRKKGLEDGRLALKQVCDKINPDARGDWKQMVGARILTEMLSGCHYSDDWYFHQDPGEQESYDEGFHEGWRRLKLEMSNTAKSLLSNYYNALDAGRTAFENAYAKHGDEFMRRSESGKRSPAAENVFRRCLDTQIEPGLSKEQEGAYHAGFKAGWERSEGDELGRRGLGSCPEGLLPVLAAMFRMAPVGEKAGDAPGKKSDVAPETPGR